MKNSNAWKSFKDYVSYMKMWAYLVCFLAGLFFLRVSYQQGLSVLFQYHYQKEKSVLRGFYKTLASLLWVGYLVLYQKMTKNIEHLGKNHHDVHYTLGDHTYKIRVRSKRGPRRKKVLQVIDEKDNDVTHEVLSYLGPSEDWHGILYNPGHLKYEQLTFNLSSGDVKTFSRDEPIQLIGPKDLDDLIQSLPSLS